ncbi:MAG: BatD family protein [Myxococcales bacterium]|nr:BatD family protein [Myxococcales bacterium]
MKALRLVLLALAVLFGVSPSAAQPVASMRTQVSSRRVEVGESFTLTLTAMTDKGTSLPQSPSLSAPTGVSVQGPSVAMQQQVTLQGGSFLQRFGISATWTLVAQRPGRYRIGPPSVTVGARRVTGDTVEVEVVAAGSGTRPRHRDPLDPFGFGLPGFPLGGDDPPADLPAFPDELKVDRAEEPGAFLRAVASPMKVVMGEQVTLKIFAYGSRGPFRETNTSEPSRESFLAHTVLENSYTETLHRVPIGGETWHAKKVRELALFPIRTGKLTIGAMRLGFDGRGYPSSAAHKGLVRYSAPLTIEVIEPPTAGRPAGYKPGDVGRFALSANVEPREITAGDAVSVVAKLEGTGNLPLALKTPQRTGVTWLEPTTVEEIEPRGSRVGGWRKLTYVVRIDTAGEVDLGELTLPYWDPERESYDVAKATLGSIRVKPGNLANKLPAKDDPLAGVLGLRKTLGDPGRGALVFSDHRLFWLAIFLAPVGVVLAGAGQRFGKRLSARWRQKAESHASLAQQALGDARAALKRSDAAAAASQAERAVLLAVEGATGLRARAVLKSELGSELASHGVSAALAGEIVTLLERCDDLRFTGSAGSQSSEDLVEGGARIVRSLGRAA